MELTPATAQRYVRLAFGRLVEVADRLGDERVNLRPLGEGTNAVAALIALRAPSVVGLLRRSLRRCLPMTGGARPPSPAGASGDRQSRLASGPLASGPR